MVIQKPFDTTCNFYGVARILCWEGGNAKNIGYGIPNGSGMIPNSAAKQER